jgi:hypothetical protein
MSEGDNQAAAGGAGSFSGGGSFTDPRAWADAINAGIFTQSMSAQMRQDAQGNPCGAAAFWREYMGANLRFEWDDKEQAVRQRAQFLPLTIRDSLERRGMAPPGSDLAEGKALGEFAVEVLDVEDLIPASDLIFITLFAGPFPHLQIGARMAFIQDHMPSGLSLANGSWRGRMSNTGTRISEGVYLKNGVYRGATILQLIDRWIQYQIENVSSPALGNARTDLIRMVGTWQGTGEYGIWQEGDGVATGSELGILRYMWNHLTELEGFSTDLCNAIHIAEQRRADETLSGGLSLAEEALALERLAIEAKQRRDYGLIAVAMVGAFVVARG